MPTEYFLRVLGRHLKYSCCLYGKSGTSLDDAEEAMLGVGWLWTALPVLVCWSADTDQVVRSAAAASMQALQVCHSCLYLLTPWHACLLVAAQA